VQDSAAAGRGLNAVGRPLPVESKQPLYVSTPADSPNPRAVITFCRLTISSARSLRYSALVAGETEIAEDVPARSGQLHLLHDPHVVPSGALSPARFCVRR
jgi:hypothetical protein